MNDQTLQSPAASPAESIQLEDQLLRMAYERLPMSLLMSAGVVVIFFGLLWPLVPSHLMVIWGSSIFWGLAPRCLLWWAYRRARPGPDAVAKWRRWYLAGVVLGGAGWTVGPVLMVLHGPGETVALLVATLLAVCAVAMNSNGSQRGAMQAFVGVVLLPFALALFFSPSSVGATLAFIVLAGMASIILVGRASHRGLRQLLQARMDFQVLAEEAKLARTKAEAASVAKTRFLANMSHELRTPLNAVIGAAQLLRAEEAEPERQAHLVDAIQRSGTNLLGLIENILDLSRIEAGELPLHPLDFHLVECVESALSTAALAAHAKGLKLACVVDPQLDPWRHGDGDRLRQVLLNLLGNAAKFTEHGEIVLRVSPGAAAQAVRFTVTDTGVGIGEASLPHVFKPFRQADDAADRRYGGSGLGLAIVQQLVQAMRGSVQVTSTLGIGSCFVVEVVLPPSAQPAAEPSRLGQRVAFVEPHEASAEAMLAHLQRLGCEARRCSNGAELSAWLHSAGSDPPPWVLLAADEIDASACIDAVVDLVQPERLIVMSTRVSHEVDHALDGQQLSRQMVKPVTRAALVSRMGARDGLYLAERVPASVLTHAQVDALTHVLVVEDDELNRLIVSGILQHAGCRVSLASGGSEALNALAQDDRVDLVLMDWQMPDMDGLEATQRLRAGAAGPAGQTVPIIALTANAFAEDRAACLAAGMNDFLSKPVLATSLVAAVQRWAPRRGASHASAPMRRVPAPVAQSAAVYDASVLAALPMVADGSAPEYPQQVLALFLESQAQTLQDLERASAAQDGALLCRLVHTLKSASAAVGALELAEMAGLQEQQLRQGLPPASDLTDRLGRAFARLRRAIETSSPASLPQGVLT
jgi:signal transduction histidine kinase/CheY-like chemotaxis protein/HPt (histidine-containing phosphotransfer) domain-containing protein